MEFSTIRKISYILKFYRRKKGFSQFEMADAIGVSPRNYQRLELGEVEPRIETLVQIAKTLNIPISSLIRETHFDLLTIHEVSTSQERLIYQELNAHDLNSGADFSFAAKLIRHDLSQLPSAEFQVHLEGTTAVLSDNFKTHLGLSHNTIDITDHVLAGSPVERWELIFRHKLTSALDENVYMFPCGFKALQAFHHTINPNPLNPVSDIYIRDITARHELRTWMQQLQKNNTIL